MPSVRSWTVRDFKLKLLAAVLVTLGIVLYTRPSQPEIINIPPTPTGTTPLNPTPTSTTPPYTQENAAWIPKVEELVISESEGDISANWNDDDGNFRYVTLLYKPTIDGLNELRDFVGSVHDYEKEKVRTTVFGVDVSDDYYGEVRTFSYIRYVTLPNSFSEQEAYDHIITESKRLYSKFLFVPLYNKTLLQSEGLAKSMNEFSGSGPIKVAFDDAQASNILGHIRGEKIEGTTINGTAYFSKGVLIVNRGRCSLLRNMTSVYRSKLLYANDNEHFIKKEKRNAVDDRLVCLSIATYSGGKVKNMTDFSLFQTVVPSFLNSTREVDTPTTRYRFAMYLGIQRDPYFDQYLEEIKKNIVNATQDRSFSLRVIITPINAPTMDITYKWNVVIDQGYRDGCDYLYQFSDDTTFVTPWVDEFINFLEAESNFGVVGATDLNNLGTMTLSFTHRNHIKILGSYWPTHLKNWWSDNWVMTVYGLRYTQHFKHVLMYNRQTQGTRYEVCNTHGALFNQLIAEESRPNIISWLHKQPQTYDIRQKLDYFTEKKAQGEKR